MELLRLRNYKNCGKDTEVLRRKRNLLIDEMRKNKRLDAFMKRRKVCSDDQTSNDTEMNEIEEEELFSDDEFWQFVLQEEAHYLEQLLSNANAKEVEWALENQFSVICFSCKSHPFKVHPGPNSSMIMCESCGFNFTITAYLSPEVFYQHFNSIIDQHSNQCNQIVNFVPSRTESNNVNGVQIMCNNCNFFRMLFQSCDI